MKLLVLLTLLLSTQIAYAVSGSIDSLPFKIKLYGQEAVVYSIEQDRQILLCFEEREMMQDRIFADSITIEACLASLETCKALSAMNNKLLNEYVEEIDLYKQQESVMVQRFLLERDANDKLVAKLNYVEAKAQRTKVRNTVLWAVAGVVAVGLVGALIGVSVM